MYEHRYTYIHVLGTSMRMYKCVCIAFVYIVFIMIVCIVCICTSLSCIVCIVSVYMYSMHPNVLYVW
jgi:hypothetical protein